MKGNELPLVTVVTASYNNTDRIYDTIESVCMQTYKRIEYIICDDSSESFPYDRVESFALNKKKDNIENLTIYSNDTNLGTVKNLNRAYKTAKGSIILPLSCGDCFFNKNTIQLVVERFLATKCKVLATTMIKYKGNFEPIEMIPHYDERALLYNMDSSRKQYEAFITYHFHNMIAGCNLYITKRAIEENDYFDEKYDLWEDGPFLSKFLFKNRIEYAYDIVSIWYEDGGVSAKPFDFHIPRMRADAEIFASTDAIKHIDSFSFIDRRRINYRYKRIAMGHCKKRYLLYLAYLPELIHYLRYTKKMANLNQNDMKEISSLLASE